MALILPCTLVLVAFFENIPRDLENAAMIDGCTRLGALFQVVVPLAAPGVFTAGILAFVNSWDEFLLALSFNSSAALRTLPVGITLYQGEFSFPWPALSVGGLMVQPSTMLCRNFLAMEAEEARHSHPIGGAAGRLRQVLARPVGGSDLDGPAGDLLPGWADVEPPAARKEDGCWHPGREVLGRVAHRGDHRSGPGKPDDALDRRLRHHGRRVRHDLDRGGDRHDADRSLLDPRRRLRTRAGGLDLRRADRRHRVRRPEAVGHPDRRQPERRHRSLHPPGGSANAAIHLIAIAGWACRSIWRIWRRCRREPRVLGNLSPSGERLAEDFRFAGGFKALLKSVEPHPALDCRTAEGRAPCKATASAEWLSEKVIRPVARPVVPLERGRTLVLLKGDLAPDGAAMKSSAADPEFMRHQGQAIVFGSPAGMRAKLDDLDVGPGSVLVLRTAGPTGAPGMPERGNLPIARKLLQGGFWDVARICDGRSMSASCAPATQPRSASGLGVPTRWWTRASRPGGTSARQIRAAAWTSWPLPARCPSPRSSEGGTFP